MHDGARDGSHAAAGVQATRGPDRLPSLPPAPHPSPPAVQLINCFGVLVVVFIQAALLGHRLPPLVWPCSLGTVAGAAMVIVPSVGQARCCCRPAALPLAGLLAAQPRLQPAHDRSITQLCSRRAHPLTLPQGTSGGLDSGSAWLGFALSIVFMLSASLMYILLQARGVVQRSAVPGVPCCALQGTGMALCLPPSLPPSHLPSLCSPRPVALLTLPQAFRRLRFRNATLLYFYMSLTASRRRRRCCCCDRCCAGLDLQLEG